MDRIDWRGLFSEEIEFEKQILKGRRGRNIKPLKRLGEFRGGNINPRALKHSPIVFWVGRERVATDSRIFYF